MIDFPNPPAGSSHERDWMRRLIAACRASRIVPGRGYKLHPQTNGTMLNLIGEPGAGIRISTYRYKSHEEEHIICRSWNGTTEGTEDVKIAKPHELRYSIESAEIGAVFVTYSGYDVLGQQRIATPSGGTAETQLITPRYIPDRLIFAVSAFTDVTIEGDIPEDDEELTLIDLNVGGRAWAAQ